MHSKSKRVPCKDICTNPEGRVAPEVYVFNSRIMGLEALASSFASPLLTLEKGVQIVTNIEVLNQMPKFCSV